jgi:thiol:disulfide interchange protein/DsbC/DsbD-like thiol-disulfide interchange protein
MTRFFLWVFTIALLLPIGTAPFSTARAQDTNHAHIDLIPAHTHPQAGEVISVIIRQTIAPEWHTYWINPGDSGAAPTIHWTLPDGFEAGDILWPTPKRIPYAGLVNFGYEGTISLLQDIYLPNPLPEGPVTLNARIEILVCKDICIPEFKDLSLTLLDPAAEPVDNNEILQTAFADIPLQVDWEGTYYEEKGRLIVEVNSPTPAIWNDVSTDSFQFFPRDWGITKNTVETKFMSLDSSRILALAIDRDNRPLSDISILPVLISHKNNDGETRAIEITLKPHPEKSVAQPAPTTKEESAILNIGLGQALIFALIGGLILNLMPCVFPILSMKALSLVKLQGQSRRIAVQSGLAYTAGIMISFAVLAALLLGLKSGGESLGWGFHLQNPVITLFLAYLLFVIGLNLSGLFDFSLKFGGIGASLTQKQGWSGSFFTGILATIVATPCTAPFMAGALGFALVQPASIAVAIFLMLGFGLALPYLLVSCSPVLTRLLPRPGPWMVRFKEFLAFPMFASAAWLVWVLAQQAGSDAVMWALSGMVALALGIWMARHKPQRKFWRVLAGLIAAIIFLFALLPLLDPHILRTQSQSDTRVMTQDYNSADYAVLLDGDDPVFVYMTAAWCITCKVNERVAIDTDETHALFKEKNVRLVRGDWTTMNTDITLFLKKYGRSGVPLYVYHGPRDKNDGNRPDAVILPQILTPAIVAETLNK